MTTASRPLRSIMVILAAWMIGRTVAWWSDWADVAGHSLADHAHRPASSLPALRPSSIAPTRKVATPIHFDGAITTEPSPRAHHASLASLSIPIVRSAAPFTSPSIERALPAVAPPHASETAILSVLPASSISIAASLSETYSPKHPPMTALSGSGWLLMRGSGPAGLGNTGELGGSQAGLRLNYALGRDTLDLTTRLSAPLGEAQGKEVAVGLSVRPSSHLPLTLIAEQRIAVDRSGRTDFELVAVGGIYDHPLGHGVTLSSSAQAGIVGIKARDLFIDGAAQIEHIVIRHGSARLSFGAAVWGAAQPSLSRLDAGPTAALRFRLGVVTAKAEASYRVRLIGTARPTTGPALSLGTDF